MHAQSNPAQTVCDWCGRPDITTARGPDEHALCTTCEARGCGQAEGARATAIDMIEVTVRGVIDAGAIATSEVQAVVAQVVADVRSERARARMAEPAGERELERRARRLYPLHPVGAATA